MLRRICASQGLGAMGLGALVVPFARAIAGFVSAALVAVTLAMVDPPALAATSPLKHGYLDVAPPVIALTGINENNLTVGPENMSVFERDSERDKGDLARGINPNRHLLVPAKNLNHGPTAAQAIWGLCALVKFTGLNRTRKYASRWVMGLAHYGNGKVTPIKSYSFAFPPQGNQYKTLGVLS